MLKNDKSLRTTSLILAACLSVPQFVVGLAILSFSGIDLEMSARWNNAVWLVPLLELPLFGLTFVSRRLLRWAIWMAFAGNYCCGVALEARECSRGNCIPAGPIGTAFMDALGCLLFPQVFLSLIIAILVDYSYRLGRRERLNLVQ